MHHPEPADRNPERVSGSKIGWKAWTKIGFLSILTGSLFSCWLDVKLYELGRGRAKFHFEDFADNKEMQRYFDEHYPVGGDTDILAYNIETARLKCWYQVDSEEFKRRYSGVDFDYYGTWDCSAWKWELSYNIYSEYIIIHTDIYGNIIRIKAYKVGVQI